MPPLLRYPVKTTLCITQRCNLKCRHCYADCNEERAAEELSTEEWCRFIDYLVGHGFIQVYIEGGEPLVRPDFIDILRRCTPHMMTLLRTNGTLIDAPTAETLRSVGVGRVLVDVMGARAETHEGFTGVAGSFERSCAAVRHLVAAGISTDMLIILTRQNAGELQGYLELAHDLGVPRAGILRLYPLGRAKGIWSGTALPLADQMAALGRLRPPPGLKVMQSWHPYDRNCCWQSAAVSPFGDSIGCAYLREYVRYGNIRDMPFLETWDNELYRFLRNGEVDQACPDCSASQGTRGGCRAAAYAFHGSWSAPDPYCAHLNAGVRLDVLPERLLQDDA